MKRRLPYIILIVGAVIVSGCNLKSKSVASISLDFPHGEARLLVRRDGETHLFYGALPASRIIANDTFDIDELYDDLRNRIHEMVPAEKRPLGQPSGMVTIGFSDGSSRDYLIYDEDYANELFKTACTNTVDVDEWSQEFYDRVCADIKEANP